MNYLTFTDEESVMQRNDVNTALCAHLAIAPAVLLCSFPLLTDALHISSFNFLMTW